VDGESGINILSFIFRLSPEKISEILIDEGLDDQCYRIPREFDFLKEVIHRIEDGLRETSRFGTFWSRKRFGLKSSVHASIEVLSNQNTSDAVFDYCCHPKSGDEIVGFMIEGKAHIHHKMCKNAATMIEKHEPMLFVRWVQQQFNRYHLIISMPNAQGALAELLTYMAKMGADINSIELGKEKSEHTQYCEMEFQTLENDLNRLKSKLEKKGKIIQFFRTDDAYRSQG
jgi:GTP pyrophosphokinase